MIRRALVPALLMAALPLTGEARPRLVAIQGATLPGAEGAVIATLGLPVSDGRGRLAFTGTFDDGDGFIWREGGVLWRNSFATPPPTGAAPFMGLGDDDQFVYRTRIGDDEALWSHHGPLIQVGDPAPGIAGGVIEFNRRAMMTPGGTAFWIAQFRDDVGPDGVGRALYVAADAAPENIELVLRSDDLVDGLPLGRPRGLDIEFRVSRNLEHLIQVVELDTGSTFDDGAVYVDGHLALREGDDAGMLSRWTRFRRVAINNAGDYLVSATTDAPPRRDYVLAYNGSVALREGRSVDGVKLRRSATVLGLDIDDRGRAAHVWSTSGLGPEHLFFACDAADLRGSRRILTAPSPLMGMRIFRFIDTAFGPAVWLSPASDTVYAQVELVRRIPGGELESLEAIVAVDVPACPDVNRAAESRRSPVEADGTDRAVATRPGSRK